MRKFGGSCPPTHACRSFTHSRRRGSAMLFIMMMVMAITAIVVVGASLSMMSINDQRREEDREAASYTWEAALAQLDADFANNAVILPATRQVSLNGVTGTMTVVDNSNTMTYSALATATLTTPNGRTYGESTVVSKDQPPNVADYALYVATTVTGLRATTTGKNSSLGDTFVIGNANFASGSVINGNLSSTLGIGSGFTVTGISTTGALPPLIFPTLLVANYLLAANSTTLGSQTSGIPNFMSVGAGQPYELRFINGDFNIQASTFSGRGTYFAANDIYINGNLNYSNSNSTLVLIAAHDIYINADAYGYLFAGNVVHMSAQNHVVTGGIATTFLDAANKQTVILDPYVRSNPSEGKRLHMPGLWP